MKFIYLLFIKSVCILKSCKQICRAKCLRTGMVKSMNNNNADTMLQETDRRTLRGELALIAAVLINSFGVVLMLYSGAGISAISSVPFAFSEVFTKISLGTWTYLFQGLLVLTLMILRKKFVPQYLFSFVVGFAFGEFLDVHELWILSLIHI